MKVYVKLGLNTEYYGYDIFEGVYASIEEAIDATTLKWAPLGDDLRFETYTHVDYTVEDEQGCGNNNNPIHTHVVFVNKRGGIPTRTELKNAVEDGDEANFYNSDNDYIILESIVIEEREL